MTKERRKDRDCHGRCDLAMTSRQSAYNTYRRIWDIIITMRISFEWLKEFVDVTATPEEVAERLTMIGFEVEGAESVGDDTVFEVNVTPNRPDCLSIIGIAREISAAFKLPMTIPACDIKEELPIS